MDQNNNISEGYNSMFQSDDSKLRQKTSAWAEKAKSKPDNSRKKLENLNRYEHYFSGSYDMVLALEDAVFSAIKPLDLLEVYLDEVALMERCGDPKDYLNFVINIVSSTIYQVKDDINYVLRLSGELREIRKTEQAA